MCGVCGRALSLSKRKSWKQKENHEICRRREEKRNREDSPGCLIFFWVCSRCLVPLSSSSSTHVFAKVVDEVARREEVDGGKVLSSSRVVVVACRWVKEKKTGLR